MKIKREVDGKINLSCYCFGCSLRKFENIDNEELSDLLKNLNYIKNNVSVLFETQKKYRKQPPKGL